MAIGFDADNSEYAYGDCPGCKGMARFTISCWVRFDGLPGYAPLFVVLSTGDSTWDVLVDYNALPQGFRCLVRSNSGYGYTTGGTSAYQLGRLYHVVARYDDTGDRKVDIFLDGREDTPYAQEVAVSGTKSAANGSVVIGARKYTLVYKLDGSLQEIAVWNKCLSDEQIGWLRSAGQPTTRLPLTIEPANLQLYLPCEDYRAGVDYLTVRDRSANGYTLAGVNTPTGVADGVATLGGGPLSVIAIPWFACDADIDRLELGVARRLAAAAAGEPIWAAHTPELTISRRNF